MFLQIQKQTMLKSKHFECRIKSIYRPQLTRMSAILDTQVIENVSCVF
jgi:hypothetical protein